MAYAAMPGYSDTVLESLLQNKAPTAANAGKLNVNTGGSNPSYKTKSLKSLGILGIPYRFNGYCDVPMGRLYDKTQGADHIGRVYDQNILANAPITFFEVGKPVFLPGHKDHKDSILGRLISNAEEVVEDMYEVSEALFGGKSKYSANQLRYYGFEDDFMTYASYVNAMVRFTSIKMGIGDMKSPDMANRYAAFKLETMKNKLLTNSGSLFPSNVSDDQKSSDIGYLKGLIRDIKQAIPTSYHVPMYCTASETSHSENVQTSTGESMVASTTKGISQLGRELSFILNGSDLGKFGDDAIKNLTNGLSDLTNGIGVDGALTGILKQVTTGAATIASGSNMLFPEIWQDTTYTKSYNIGISLTTPYGDPSAIMNDIYLPLFCILAMAMPRQTYSSGYGAPFIIKAYSKGYFNCDMGMIESVEIRKGGSSNTEWTVNGLPTALDITISIKDLYPAIVATQKDASAFFFSGNTGLTEHLNLLAGVDLIAIDPLANFGAAAVMTGASIGNMWEHSEHVIRHNVYKQISSAVNKYFS